jgi:hypothetical protein
MHAAGERADVLHIALGIYIVGSFQPCAQDHASRGITQDLQRRISGEASQVFPMVIACCEAMHKVRRQVPSPATSSTLRVVHNLLLESFELCLVAVSGVFMVSPVSRRHCCRTDAHVN